MASPQLTLYEKCSLPFIMLLLPFVLLSNISILRRSERNKSKPIYRILFDCSARFVLSWLTIRQLQSVSGTSYAAYEKWLKQEKTEPIVDVLQNDARLLWIGPKRTDRVIIYCHGGGFVGPLSDFEFRYFKDVQQALSEKLKGEEVGVALLEYAVWPSAFPKQLQQLVSAVQHIISTGVEPSNLFLVGNSAGGNLVIQLLAHTLHPISDIPSPLLADGTTVLGGVCLISPFVSLAGDSGSYVTNANLDLFPPSCLQKWGQIYMTPVPTSQQVYIQVNTAPQSWLSGVDKIVKRFFITAATKELLRDDIIKLSDNLSVVHPDVKLEVQLNAVHADPVFDVAAQAKTRNYVTGMLIDWLAEGFVGAA